MARIRTLKPDVWSDERVGVLSREARLLWIGLITQADDEGRLRLLEPALLGAIFPYDPDAASELDEWLQEIYAVGLARRYLVEGQWYLWLPGWGRHQRINRPSPSALPAPPDRTAHGGVLDGSVSPPGSAPAPSLRDVSVSVSAPGGLTGGREGIGKEELPSPNPIPQSGMGNQEPTGSRTVGSPRQLGTNPRALGTNPRALGTNPKALGVNPRALGQAAQAALHEQAAQAAAAALERPDTVDRVRWQDFRTHLAKLCAKHTWELWVRRLELAGTSSGQLVLDVPDEAREWMAAGRVERLLDQCAEISGVPARMATTAEHDGLVGA